MIHVLYCDSCFTLYNIKDIYCFFFSFHITHCIEALMHTDGDLGKALEVLFYKYYGIEEVPRNVNFENLDEADLLRQLREEKEIMESIYDDAFCEKIKNRIWTVQLKLNYLTNNPKTEQVVVKEKKQEKEKEICRLFARNKCRFGDKCRFLHQLPKKVSDAPVQEDPYFTLEIRFPEGTKRIH